MSEMASWRSINKNASTHKTHFLSNTGLIVIPSWILKYTVATYLCTVQATVHSKNIWQWLVASPLLDRLVSFTVITPSLSCLLQAQATLHHRWECAATCSQSEDAYMLLEWLYSIHVSLQANDLFKFEYVFPSDSCIHRTFLVCLLKEPDEGRYCHKIIDISRSHQQTITEWPPFHCGSMKHNQTLYITQPCILYKVYYCNGALVRMSFSDNGSSYLIQVSQISIWQFGQSVCGNSYGYSTCPTNCVTYCNWCIHQLNLVKK